MLRISFIAYIVIYLITQPVFAQQTRPMTTNTPSERSIAKDLSQDSILSRTDNAIEYQKRLELQRNFDASVPKINVHILGEVEYPGIYKIPVSTRASDALTLALPKRDFPRIIEIRQNERKTRQYDLYKYYYQGHLSQNPFLNENDIIFVPPLKGAVRIEGPVARPGIYELYHEDDINDLIRLSGGTTSATSKIHPVKIIRFSENGKKFVLDVENTKTALRNFKVEKGDIIVIPDIINNPKAFDYSVELIPGENTFYPTSTPTVFVLGSVQQSGSFPYKAHLRVKDYVSYASPTTDARLKTVTLIRNGKKERFQFDQKPIPGDILVVKSKPNFTVLLSSVSTVLSVILTAILVKENLAN